ncbi:prephenate dehydrogenase [Mycobacterium sp. 155]|uniref:prephenate dehydrogenase n=1 Tax=Mycobacterium sp. 155 TaxID=1157943 RepID=UPI0004778365|nr:prephenate dehydrogenase [Mycobacterium sp. 155]
MTNTPVCVVGLGLIGGSLMRAAAAAGREVFGYNRSVDVVQAARFDGFDASDNLNETLRRAVDRDALIVLAVPMPALPLMLGHIRDIAPTCPLTDVISVKGAVLQQVQKFGLLNRFVGGHPMAGTADSGWAAGNSGMFVGAPWVVSVDDHVDAEVWTQVTKLALDCHAVVVPACSEEHDAAAAAISHLPHLFAETLALNAAEVPLAFALAAGSFRDGTRVAATAPDLVRAMCEANAAQLLPALEQGIEVLKQARDSLATTGSLADLVEGGHSARMRYANFVRPEIVTTVVGAENWRTELAAAGRAGGVIRSALPVLGSRE